MKYILKLYTYNEYTEKEFENEEKITDFLFDNFEDTLYLRFIEDIKNHKIYTINKSMDDDNDNEDRKYLQSSLHFLIADTKLYFSNYEYDRVAFITKNEN